MKITCTASVPDTLLAGHAIAVFVGESSKSLPAWTRKLPDALHAALNAAVSSESFNGKIGQTEIVRTETGTAVLVGGGSDTGAESLRRIYGALCRDASNARLKHVSAPLLSGRDVAAAAEAATVGARLGNYRFYRFRSEPDKLTPPVEALTLWEADAARRRSITAGIARGSILAAATMRVRDLVNTPANELTPKSYAELARQWFADSKVKLQVLGPREITRAGMGAVMAVAGGSANEPRFLIASYLGRPGRIREVDVALVGKGVTFDTGGITLKPGQDMWEMRGDMMGSAVMLSAIDAAARLSLKHNVIAVTPLVENMPSATAYRPGDIVKTLSGQTIEIISTDAEGRLILADALTYVQRFKPRVVIDCATLTGAMAVALGEVCCGVFTDHDAIWRAVETASAATGEMAWRMPLHPGYDHLFESPVADMRNSGGRYGGAGIAARILRRFTGDLPWLHIDIAGVDNYKKGHEYCPAGASGFGARLVIELLRQPAWIDLVDRRHKRVAVRARTSGQPRRRAGLAR